MFKFLISCHDLRVLALGGVVLAVSRYLIAVAPIPQRCSEAARLNTVGEAYMNQQLFEKGLKSFQEAAAARSQVADRSAESGRGIT